MVETSTRFFGRLSRLSSLACIVAACVCASCSAAPRHVQGAQPQLALTVSMAGVDSNDGSRERPFATLERARDEVRALRQAGRIPATGAVIEILPGRYRLSRAFELGAGDSGRDGAPVVYRAVTPGTVVLDGARATTSRPVTDEEDLARFPASARAHVRVVALEDFDDIGGDAPISVIAGGASLPLSRWPEQGFATISSVESHDPIEVRGLRGDRVGRITTDEPHLSRWSREPAPWAHGYWFWDWAETRSPVAHIDPATRTLELAPPYHHYGYRAGQWFYVYNLFAELDRPGEWVVDTAQKKLFVWPPSETVGVSSTKTLLSIKDASSIVLDGLVFEGARGTAVTLSSSSGIVLRHCEIRAIGGWAIQMTGGHGNQIERCDLHDIGEGGIWLEGGDRKTLERGDHRAAHNHIHDYSRWKRTGRGAIELRGVGNIAASNVIDHAPNAGIVFFGNDHLIENNEIARVCEETNDAGAIGAGRDWTMRGTVIRRNYLHDIHGRDNAGCNGVMLDDLFSGTEITDNTFVRVARAIIIGGGRDNRIERNMFAGCKQAITVDARGTGWAAYSVKDTMIPRLREMPYESERWRARYPSLATILDEDPASPRGNVIKDNLSFGGRWLDVAPIAAAVATITTNLVFETP